MSNYFTPELIRAGSQLAEGIFAGRERLQARELAARAAAEQRAYEKEKRDEDFARRALELAQERDFRAEQAALQRQHALDAQGLNFDAQQQAAELSDRLHRGRTEAEYGLRRDLAARENLARLVAQRQAQAAEVEQLKLKGEQAQALAMQRATAAETILRMRQEGRKLTDPMHQRLWAGAVDAMEKDAEPAAMLLRQSGDIKGPTALQAYMRANGNQMPPEMREGFLRVSGDVGLPAMAPPTAAAGPQRATIDRRPGIIAQFKAAGFSDAEAAAEADAILSGK